MTTFSGLLQGPQLADFALLQESELRRRGRGVAAFERLYTVCRGCSCPLDRWYASVAEVVRVYPVFANPSLKPRFLLAL